MFRFTIRDVLWLTLMVALSTMVAALLSVGIRFGTIALCDCAWEAANKLSAAS
jgi:hypothetical protein